MGDKVGFIQLPPKPGRKAAEKRLGQLQPPQRGHRNRGGRICASGRRYPRRAAVPRQRPEACPCQAAKLPSDSRSGAPAKDREPATPKVASPADAKVITIKPPIVVRDLAEQLKQKPFKIIADLMELDVFANVNQAIDETVAQTNLRQIRLPV